MELTGKTALVTGAGGDLGSELVRALIAAGAQHVIAFDIDAAKLAALKSPQVSTVCCDISQFETTYPVLKQVYQDHQSVDILINGAGILYSAPLVNLLEKSDDAMQQAAENWQRLIAVNLSSRQRHAAGGDHQPHSAEKNGRAQIDSGCRFVCHKE